MDVGIKTLTQISQALSTLPLKNCVAIPSTNLIRIKFYVPGPSFNLQDAFLWESLIKIIHWGRFHDPRKWNVAVHSVRPFLGSHFKIPCFVFAISWHSLVSLEKRSCRWCGCFRRRIVYARNDIYRIRAASTNTNTNKHSGRWDLLRDSPADSHRSWPILCQILDKQSRRNNRSIGRYSEPILSQESLTSF